MKSEVSARLRYRDPRRNHKGILKKQNTGDGSRWSKTREKNPTKHQTLQQSVMKTAREQIYALKINCRYHLTHSLVSSNT